MTTAVKSITAPVDAMATARPMQKAAAAPTPVKRRNRKRYNAGMKILRRVHMYFGLVLTPFVLLYGVTAMLFNHPEWFSSSTTIEAEPTTFESTSFPAAAVLADGIIRAMREKAEVPIEPVAGDTPRFTGDILIDATNDAGRSRIRITPDTMDATVRQTRSTRSRAPTSVLPRDIEPPATASLDAIVTEVARAFPDDRVSLRAAPDIEFRVVADDEEWVVSCDTRSGEVTRRRASEPRREFSLRSFLLRLHVAHGYPDEVTARWIWAVLVDITAAVMIFWAFSGLFMWWQMKPTRQAGVLTVVGGAALAACLGYAMLRLIYF